MRIRFRATAAIAAALLCMTTYAGMAADADWLAEKRTPPQTIQTVNPEYPAEARAEGTEGTTVLRVFINKAGEAGQVEIATSSGDATLDEAARAAVLRWRFKPAMINGMPEGMWVHVPVAFRLVDPEPETDAEAAPAAGKM